MITDLHGLRVSLPPSLRILWSYARLWYEIPVNRKYHTWLHAREVAHHAVLCAPKEMQESERHRSTLVLAGLWHDAVYVPRAPNDMNEMMSARALKYEGHSYSEVPRTVEDLEIVDNAAKLIEYTTISWHLTKETDIIKAMPMVGALLDADLRNLALDYPFFEGLQTEILDEMLLDKSNENMKHSAQFLMQFLEREFIYHTEYAREQWEAKARANILKYHKLYAGEAS